MAPALFFLPLGFTLEFRVAEQAIAAACLDQTVVSFVGRVRTRHQ
jgi:hypothetical protein